MGKNRIIERIESMTDIDFDVGNGVKTSHSKIFKYLKRTFNFKNLFTTHNSQFTKLAFTLAETLIVMGIIGVVAALTLPNLNSSTGDREKVAKVKKIYQNLTDAFGRAQAVYGPIDEWFIKDNDTVAKNRFAERMLDYFKVSKNCDDKNTISCTSEKIHKLLDGSDAFDDTSNQKSVLLADGAGLTFSISSKECNYGSGFDEENICGIILVDVDGASGANVFGKDTFTFWVKKDGIYPAGYQESNLGKKMRQGDMDVCISKDTEQNSCASWVIEYGNMDYLKLKNGKCPNGTTLSATQTSCK